MSNHSNLTSTYSILRRYVAEFINSYASQTGNSWKSKALRKKYFYSETDTEDVPKDKDMANLLGVTPESVRNIYKLAVDFCDELAQRQDDAFMTIKGIKRVEVKRILMKRLGFGHDEKTLRFYLDGMGYTITDQKEGDSYCVDTKYYGKGLTGILREVIPYVKDILTSNPVPIRLEDVMDKLKAKGFDDTRLQFAEDYMLADSDTCDVESRNNGLYVSIKWEALPSVLARQVRILYDYAVKNGFDVFMNKADLIVEYNTRVYLYDNIEKIDEYLSVGEHDHIEPGGNGTYRYIGNPRKKANKPDLKAELLKYIVSHNGIAPFNDLRKFVDDSGWKYSDTTIKMYLSGNGCSAAWKKGEGKRTYYILDSFWDTYVAQGYYQPGVGKGPGKVASQPPAHNAAIIKAAVDLLKASPGNTMRKKALVDAVVNLYPSPSITNVYKLLQNAPAIVSSGSGKGGVYTLADNTKNQ